MLKVHPRMCGVLKSGLRMSAAAVGSSPHVRGFVCWNGNVCTRTRFIPACAGFCNGLRKCICANRVHPRMCGVLR